MDNNKEQVVNSLESLWGGSAEAPVAEEPIVAEEPAKEDVVEEPTKPKAETEEAAVEEVPVEEAPKEEAEPQLTEDGKILLSLGGEEVADEVPVDDLKAQNKALLEEIESLKNNSNIDPRIAKMNEYVKNGGEINANFWELQNKDYSNIDLKDSKQALSALKDKLKYLDGFESDEIDFHIEKNYPILGGFEDDADDAEIREESMKLRMGMKDALPKLKEYQNKVSMPKVDDNRREAAEKQLNMYRAHSSSKLDEIKSFDVQLDADTTISIPFSGEGRKYARSIITEPENQAKFFSTRYTTEKGELDYNKWARDLYEMENRDKIHSGIYAQGKSAGKKEILAEVQPEKQTTIKKPSISQAGKYDHIKNLDLDRPRS